MCVCVCVRGFKLQLLSIHAHVRRARMPIANNESVIEEEDAPPRISNRHRHRQEVSIIYLVSPTHPLHQTQKSRSIVSIDSSGSANSDRHSPPEQKDPSKKQASPQHRRPTDRQAQIPLIKAAPATANPWPPRQPYSTSGITNKNGSCQQPSSQGYQQ